MIRQRMKDQKLKGIREENLKKELIECTFTPNIINSPFSPRPKKIVKYMVKNSKNSE
jgi:hypothetical protein